MRGEFDVRCREQTLAFVLDDFAHARLGHSNDGKSDTSRLERREAERLAHRRQNEHIALREYRSNLFARASPADLDAVAQSARRDGASEQGAFRSVADDPKLHRQLAKP